MKGKIIIPILLVSFAFGHAAAGQDYYSGCDTVGTAVRFVVKNDRVRYILSKVNNKGLIGIDPTYISTGEKVCFDEELHYARNINF